METLRNFYNSLSSATLFDTYNKKDVIPLGIQRIDGTYASVGTTYDDLSTAISKDHLAFESSPLGVFLGKASFEENEKFISIGGGSLLSLRYVDPAFVPDDGIYILCEGNTFLNYIQKIVEEIPDPALVQGFLNLSNSNLTFAKDMTDVNKEFKAFMLSLKMEETPFANDSRKATAVEDGDKTLESIGGKKPILPEIVEIGSFGQKSIVAKVFNMLLTKNFGSAYDYMSLPYKEDIENEELSLKENLRFGEFAPFSNTMRMFEKGLLMYVDKDKKIMLTTTLDLVFENAKGDILNQPMLARIFDSFSKTLKVSYQLSTENENLLYDYLSTVPKRPVTTDKFPFPKPKEL